MKDALCAPVSGGWLDRLAILMATICGVHCLLTPVLLLVLPLLANSFWTNTNFHLWMLFLVLPTTALACFSGCRKHKDKRVAVFALVGVVLLVTATLMERSSLLGAQRDGDHSVVDTESCGSCCGSTVELEEGSAMRHAGVSLSSFTVLNLLGGLFLFGGHWRNFRLCRKAQCRC